MMHIYVTRCLYICMYGETQACTDSGYSLHSTLTFMFIRTCRYYGALCSIQNVATNSETTQLQAVNVQTYQKEQSLKVHKMIRGRIQTQLS